MTGVFGISFALIVALVAALVACSARTVERILLGTVVCSLGLGLAVQISGGSYYGLLMLGVFLATDLVVYLYFRTQTVLPSRLPGNVRSDQIFRVFFLWIAGCVVAGVAFILVQSEIKWLARSSEASAISLMHDRIWGHDWLLILVPTLCLVSMVIGGFFLVRRNR